jgi:pyruvate kinase
MLRRTKIVATLGPATDDPEVMREVMRAGMDVARINFSHGNREDQRKRVELVRRISAEVGREIGIMGDLQGPKIRVKRFADSSVRLRKGAKFFLDPALGDTEGTADGVGVAYDRLAEDLDPGDMLLLNDGQITLTVDSIDGKRVNTTVVQGGILSDHKGINRKGGGLSAPALTEKDLEDIRIAAELGLDFLAVSFVRTAEDVTRARELMVEAGGDMLIVAKIERTEAVECIESIIEATDVIMVARGDLGVEMGYAELTGIQKQIIKRTRRSNKVVITATQMMESMINNPLPTRAEVSDVANAVMDGTDAVMLSAETAVGTYPVEVVAAMSDVCRGAESHGLKVGLRTHRLEDRFQKIDEAVAMAVMYTANHMDVKAIIALTESGSTTLWMSRIRSDIPIYAFTPHERSRRRVTLYRGVTPVNYTSKATEMRQLYRDIFTVLLEKKLVNEGDLVLLTKGDLAGVKGGTNSMKIVRVDRSL